MCERSFLLIQLDQQTSNHLRGLKAGADARENGIEFADAEEFEQGEDEEGSGKSCNHEDFEGAEGASPGEMQREPAREFENDSGGNDGCESHLGEKEQKRADFVAASATNEQNEENDGENDNADGTGEREAEVVRALGEPPIEWNVGKSEHGADDGGSPSIVRSIKSTREQILRAPGEHSQRKKSQRGGGGVEVVLVHARVREDEMHDVGAFGDGESGNGNEEENDAFQGVVKDTIQVVEFTFGIELREDREGSDADGLSDGTKRNAHEGFGVLEPRNRCGDEIRSEPTDDPVVGERKRQGEHDRNGEFDEKAKAGMAEVECEGEFRSDEMRAVNLEEEISDERANENSDGESCDAVARGEKDAAGDDEQVIDNRRQRRDCEAALGVLHSAEDSSLNKTKLSGKHEASEENDLLLLGGAESGRNQGDDLRREDFRDAYEEDYQEAHEGHHGGKNVPGFVFLIFGDEFGEDRNESDAERTARDEVIQKIGQSEGGVVGVGDGVGTDLVGNGPFAQKSEQAAEQDARHDDTRGLDDLAIEAVGHGEMLHG